MPLTDEDAAIRAIGTLDVLTESQKAAKARIDIITTSNDPFIDIHELFGLYNTLYFRSLLLPRVEVSWSPRLTLCAGICELMRDPNNGNRYTRIRLKLSEALLKYRPRTDVLNTLLHEAIHAYFFITTSWTHSRGDDGTGHGPGFLLLADAINNHGGYEITVFHTFHDEVDSYRTHVWQCDGSCTLEPPFFGQVKRSMNRAPGKSDTWWERHQSECGGTFTKIAEPEPSKAQVDKLRGLKKAGRQKNKIDEWISFTGKRPREDEAEVSTNILMNNTTGEKRVNEQHVLERGTKKLKSMVVCPICDKEVAADDINEHLDNSCTS